MAHKQIGTEVTVNINQYPAEDEVCDKCGAPSTAYVKHPALKGGRCSACGGIWLPGLSFGPTKPIYADQISATMNDDGSATIHFNDDDNE